MWAHEGGSKRGMEKTAQCEPSQFVLHAKYYEGDRRRSDEMGGYHAWRIT